MNKETLEILGLGSFIIGPLIVAVVIGAIVWIWKTIGKDLDDE